MKPSSCGAWRDGMSAPLLYVPTCPVCWLVVTAGRYEIEMLHTQAHLTISTLHWLYGSHGSSHPPIGDDRFTLQFPRPVPEVSLHSTFCSLWFMEVKARTPASDMVTVLRLSWDLCSWMGLKRLYKRHRACTAFSLLIKTFVGWTLFSARSLLWKKSKVKQYN